MPTGASNQSVSAISATPSHGWPPRSSRRWPPAAMSHPAGQVTVGELHAKWVGTQGHLKATTVATREYTWARHVEGRWSGVAAADVRTSDVRSWVADMTASGAGAATVENSVSVLRQILAMAVEDRRIARNPCAGVKVPRRTHRPRGYLTHEQVELLAELSAAQVPPWCGFFPTAACVGVRWQPCG